LGSRSRYIAIAVAIGFTIFVAVLAFGVSLARFDRILSNSPSVNLAEHVVPIASGVIYVEAGNFEYIEFQVPSDASNAIVRGSYFATGNGERIYVMILGGDEFESWRNSQEAPSAFYYYSGEVKAGNIEAHVPSGGTLYLVFDNLSSHEMPVNVDSNIELFYRQ
jgi:hypothetical protein